MNRKNYNLKRFNIKYQMYAVAVSFLILSVIAGYFILPTSEAVSLDSLVLSGNLKVMTFNVYNKANAIDGHYGDERIVVAMHLINKTRPHFVGFQEILKDQLDYITGSIPGYKYIGQPRVNATYGEYNAIMYNKYRFELLEQETFWLSETPDVQSKSWSNTYRIITWGLFKEKKTGAQILVANTHFDHKSYIAREKSVELFLTRLWPKMSQVQYYVFIGDFNIKNGALIDPTTTDPELQSDLKMWKVLTGRDTLNGKNANLVDVWDVAAQKINRRASIDWILVSPNFSVRLVNNMNGYSEMIDGNIIQATDHSPVFSQLK